MSTIKNGRILLYCHYNKITKGPGTSFQSPALSQKHVRNVCHTAHQYLTKFYSDSAQDSKETSKSVTPLSSNTYDDVTDFEICAFHRNTKIQISRERNIFPSLNKHIKGYFTAKNSFAAEVTFNRRKKLNFEYCVLLSNFLQVKFSM